MFERLKLANEALSDPARRREYDESLDAAPVPVAVVETASDPAARRHLAQQSFSRARQLIEQKDFHPAVEMLRTAIRFVPDNAEYRIALAQVELKNSLWISKGLENLKEAARLEPRKVHYIRAAARALMQHGRNDEAETFARRVVELDPSEENQELLDQILLGAAAAPAPEPVAIEQGPAEETPLEAAAGGSPPERPGLFSRIFRSRS